jgi:imidazolonepropionase-like amidohydrolase
MGMRLTCVGLLFLLTMGTGNEHSPHKPIALIHVTIIDVTGGPAKLDMAVLIEHSRISDVGSRIRIPEGTEIIDARGEYLIPGLWDTHVHTAFGEWFPGAKEIALPLFVANGVTSVRDMGGDLAVLKKWRKEIYEGMLIGPRMVVAGPMLDGPQPPYPASVAISTPEDARHWVDALQDNGVDFIKMQSLIPRDAYFAGAEESRRRRITFVGHVPDAIRASEASNAGQKSIEHLTGVFEGCSSLEDDFLKGLPKTRRRLIETYNKPRADALIAEFAKNQTWQVPTLITERTQWLIEENESHKHPLAKYVPAEWEKTWKIVTREILTLVEPDPIAYRREFVQMEFRIVAQMHHAGIPFMAGTDTAPGPYVVPGFSLHDELELLVEAGFTPLEALQTATLNPAKFLGLADQLGTVEKGKIADLVLLKANPLERIGNTRNIEAVIVNGRILRRVNLDRLLKGVQVSASSFK